MKVNAEAFTEHNGVISQPDNVRYSVCRYFLMITVEYLCQ